jgi:hypothetical protein
MPKTHAILSASSAERWLTCTPSARLEQKQKDRTSRYADEGTLAHDLAELFIKVQLDLVDDEDYTFRMAEIRNSEYYNQSMQDYCDEYASYVVEKFNEARAHTSDAVLYTEMEIDLSEYIPQGFGHVDNMIVDNHTLHVIDLKYGQGILVNCENNKQMMCYALGGLLKLELLYDIRSIRLTIYQPRLNNISTWEISAFKLKEWAETVLKPTAEIAFKGEGEYVPGKHCQFCRAKSRCRALFEYNTQLARQVFEKHAELTDDEVSEILDKYDVFKSWIEGVYDYAYSQALNYGKQWPGYKLVSGTARRVYADEYKVALRLYKEGFEDHEIKKPAALKGITEIEKLIGKEKFHKLLEKPKLVLKPAGKPALVPESDKRAALNSQQAAKQIFTKLD